MYKDYHFIRIGLCEEDDMRELLMGSLYEDEEVVQMTVNDDEVIFLVAALVRKREITPFSDDEA